ncbi:MAG TPA: NUMOD3 domain-containing DNA-binding protein [Candidatus Omnitrophota bacterium]|nr:NUMOD3 domain-containing DNA-binding protein [Candidatus Omnitrophota bacterium]HPD85117.1 NUMOD3 domain-containing DNA-binding protein [Candidatus Omnitrophota bacterium]HRZ03975.1 NUMOD3 domain-containing DNA-binding protein [Candidatus Omnitrophota bacterium]
MVKMRRHSTATRRKISLAQKGSKNSMYGRHQSIEVRKKLSSRNKGKGNPMYGRKHKPETIAKIRLLALRRLAHRRG